jgi:5-methylcytosine-specific restriction protein A
MERPYVWQMIKEAVDNLNGRVSYSDIKEYINGKWSDVNQATITAQIIVLSVNHDSRIHYPENQKPRLSNANSPYDLLFNTSRGQVEKYNAERHGIWEIYNVNDRLGVRKFEGVPAISTFLFAWNPDKWNWIKLEQSIEQLNNSGNVTEGWSCASYKTIRPGDRAFLVRLGSEPKGLFASGYIASEPFLSKHWSNEDKDDYSVLINFDVLLNPETESILTLDALKVGNLVKQQWTPQSSGISIKSEVVPELEAVWFNFLTSQNIQHNPYSPAENTENKTYTEGAVNPTMQTRYERNPHARRACISYYGCSCSVCEFDFEKRFGELGRNFIHVHHLTQVATVGKSYQVDPIRDLRPVCPNCHAMLHRRNPPMTIDELKLLLT